MGIIHVYTGTGGGKTTSALGVCLRAVGWRQKAIVVQFMKARETGELRAARKIKNLTIKQFGTKRFVNTKKLTSTDWKLADDAMRFALMSVEKEPDVLVLDEINLAAKIGLVDKDDVIDILKRTRKKTTVYMTGRYAPKEFLKIADFVTEVKTTKQPKKMLCRKGIEY